MAQKKYSSLQISDLFKAFFIVLMILTALYIASIFIVFGGFWVIRELLIMNIIFSAIGGWYLYKTRIHKLFLFDEKGFILEVGKKEKIVHKWSDFDQVSLVHRGYGEFAVRLYYDQGKKFIDIPASKLKLNSSILRFEVMRLIKGSSGKKS